MKHTEDDSLGPEYRRGVGILLMSGDGKVWMGQRSYRKGWHMPQGGIQEGETPEQAMWRELAEEVGTDKAELVTEHDGWISYDLPEQWRPPSWENQYVGQTQRWFKLRFNGTDDDIRIETEDQEFFEWRWVDPDEAIECAVPFKTELYRKVLSALLGAR